MQFFKYFVITVVILALVIPADAGWFRKVFRKAKKGVKKIVKKVEKAVKKVGCKFVFGIACPAAVNGAGAMLSAGTSGLGSAVVGIGVIAGNKACRVRKENCKRSVNMVEVMVPFSDEISDFDMDEDKRVSYREFVLTVLNSVQLVDPDELMKPFVFADMDGDGYLDTQEFMGAPWLFAHADRNYVTEGNGTYWSAAAA